MTEGTVVTDVTVKTIGNVVTNLTVYTLVGL